MKIYWKGVLKGIIIGLIIFGGAFLLGGCTKIDTTSYQPNLPEATNYIVDEANVIDDKVEKELNNKLKNFQNGEIAVLTTKTIEPFSIEEYGIKLADKWKVGKAGLDNGVILIIVTEDRKVRIEVGRGTEALITDAQAGSILDTIIVPELKKGDWTNAVQKGIDSLIINMSK